MRNREITRPADDLKSSRIKQEKNRMPHLFLTDGLLLSALHRVRYAFSADRKNPENCEKSFDIIKKRCLLKAEMIKRFPK